MNSKHLSTISVFLMASKGALAIPFNSIELPRNMAMGGAGVAAIPASAPLYNPALLSLSGNTGKINFELPVASIRGYDPDDFIDSLDEFQDAELVDQLDSLIDQADVLNPGSYTLVADSADELNIGLASLSNKSLQGEIGGATIITVPNQYLGFGLLLNGSITIGSVINYRDEEVLADLTLDLRVFDQCLIDNTNLLGSCDPNELNLTYIDNLTGEVLFDSNEDLTSSGDIRGLGLSEFGVSFSTQFNIDKQIFTVGVTPKYVQVEVFDYVADVDTVDTDDFDSDRYRTSYSDFNLDVGLATVFESGFTLGLSVRNLLKQTYDMQRNGINTGNIVTIKPQIRVGAAYEQQSYRFIADIDLTKNEPVGFERESQFMALGAELDALDWLQLRVGYRHDIANSDRNTFSFGVGFSSSSLHFDLAAAGSGGEIGGAAQFGFSF